MSLFVTLHAEYNNNIIITHQLSNKSCWITNLFFIISISFSKPKLQSSQSLLSFECVYSIRVNSASVAVEGFVWKIQQWINVPAASVLCQLLQASLIAELQHFVWMFRCLHNNNSLNPATASPPNLSVFLLHHLSILPNIDYPSHPYVFCWVCSVLKILCLHTNQFLPVGVQSAAGFLPQWLRRTSGESVSEGSEMGGG